MPNEWIIDVLADLKAYAELNGLAATAAGLEDMTLVALAELSSVEARSQKAEGTGSGACQDEASTNVTSLFTGRPLA